MPPQPVQPATGQPVEGTNDANYDVALQDYGYLFVTASASPLKVKFWRKGAERVTPFDTVTVALASGQIN